MKNGDLDVDNITIESTVTAKGPVFIQVGTPNYQADSANLKVGSNAKLFYNVNESESTGNKASFIFVNTDDYPVTVEYAGSANATNDKYINAGIITNGEQLSGTPYVPTIDIVGGYLNGGSGDGLYGPGFADYNITGGTIVGVTGVEVRAGNLTISGDTTSIIGTSQTFSCNPNSNGSTTYGAGVAVVQHTTLHPIDVKISGGSIKGVRSFHQDSVEEYSEPNEVTISIEGGSFNGEVYSQKDGFIAGGVFTSDVSAYCANGYSIVKNGDSYTAGVDVDLSFTISTDSVGNTSVQVDYATDVTIDEPRTEVAWTLNGQPFSTDRLIIPTEFGEYTVTVTVYDLNGVSGTATAVYDFVSEHTVTLVLPDGTQETRIVPHNGTVTDLPTPEDTHYSYIWIDDRDMGFDDTTKVDRDLTVTAKLVMSDIDISVSIIREDGKVFLQATWTPGMDIENETHGWSIDNQQVTDDRVELTTDYRHYTFEVGGNTADGTLAYAYWEDNLCIPTDDETQIETDSGEVSIVAPDAEDPVIDQVIDFVKPETTDDDKVTVAIKGTITDTSATVDLSVEDISGNGQSWTEGMAAAVDVTVKNVDDGYDLQITVKIEVPADYLGVAAFFYDGVGKNLKRVDCSIDLETGLVTIFTDHNTPYVVQVLTTENPEPIVPVDPEEPEEPGRPVVDPDDDYVPLPPSVNGSSGSSDDTITIVACAAAAVVAALMAVFLVLMYRKD